MELVAELISQYIFDIRLLLRLRVCTGLRRKIDKYEHVATYLKMRNGKETIVRRSYDMPIFPIIYTNNVCIIFIPINSTYSEYVYINACRKKNIRKVKLFNSVHVEPDSYKFGIDTKYHTELTKTGMRRIKMYIPGSENTFTINKKTYKYDAWKVYDNDKVYSVDSSKCYNNLALFVAGKILIGDYYFNVRNVYWNSIGIDNIIFAKRTKKTYDIFIRKF